jgi:hypothetical protein
MTSEPLVIIFESLGRAQSKKNTGEWGGPINISIRITANRFLKPWGTVTFPQLFSL